MQHDHIFAPLLDIDCYVKAWQQVRKISGWKDSTQTFGLNLLPNLRALIDSIEAGAYQPDPFFVFQYCERGHHRLIKALSARDRVLHHVLCNNVLIPGLRRFLIYDNGASLSGKGISFARARLECHLHRHMRAHEREGWILLLDFRKFFDNIPHQQLIDAICRHLPSERLRELLTVILHQHETDISYLPDDTDLSAFVLNSVEHHKLPPELMTGRRYLRRGLGVGAPLSQIAGVFYPTPLDNYCKNRLGCRFYARYMDDVYLIHHDKSFLRDALAGIEFIASPYGQLWVWQQPEEEAASLIADRYLVVVDIGGRSAKSDWSVICVIDRGPMAEGGQPCVCAQWYGHIDMDLLAWKSVQVAQYYHHALLVIESNTLETHADGHLLEGGDQSHYILSEIRDVYDALYARPRSADEIRAGAPLRYGFHTNVRTKPQIISTLIAVVRDGLYEERDARCLDEMLTYEDYTAAVRDKLDSMSNVTNICTDWARNGDGGVKSLFFGIEMGQHCICSSVGQNMMFDDGTPMEEQLPDGITGWFKEVLA